MPSPVETLSDADKRVFAKAGVQFPIVAITDAAVSMVANTRYEGSIAPFTADRNYTLPAGTPGDCVELFLTIGDGTYELVILGATGVTINGGAVATEWSRLFISNEYVKFRCTATNTWITEIDGRTASYGIMRQDTGQTISDDTATKITYQTTIYDRGEITELASNRFRARRAGLYLIVSKFSLASMDDRQRVNAYIYVNGTGVEIASSFISYTSGVGTYPAVTAMKFVLVSQTIEAYVSQDGSGVSRSSIVSSDVLKPYFSVLEIL